MKGVILAGGLKVLAPIILVVALLAGSLIVKTIKYGGLRAAMFGAPVESTIGGAVGRVPFFGRLTVRVHTLGGVSPDRQIGVDFSAKSLGGYQMFHITLSAAEAKRLAEVLASASEDEP